MGFVYFIREKNSNSYKVGCSGTRDGVDGKVRNLQTGNPRELELFALIECDNHFEKEDEIQTVWDSLCIRDEWFNFTEPQVLVLLKVYGGFLSPLIVQLTEIKVSPNDDLQSMCKRKIDGSLDASIRQIAKSLNVKKWEVESMLKKLQVA